MKKIFALVVTLITTLAFASPAHATSGWMGKAEFQSVCFSLNETGCNGGTLKSDVENNCQCSPDFLRSFVSGGNTIKEYAYANSYGNHKVTVQYRVTSTGSQRAYAGTWCDDTTCIIG